MDTVAQIERLFVALSAGHAIHDIMRDDERKKGWRVVVPGDEPWLSVDDWEPTVVLSVKNKRVRIIAILAKNPGHGAFRRLIDGIKDARLRPQVIEPLENMKTILRKWGWKRRRFNSGFNSEEIWQPPEQTK